VITDSTDEAATVTNVSRSFYPQDGGKSQLAEIRNKIASPHFVGARNIFTRIVLISWVLELLDHGGIVD